MEVSVVLLLTGCGEKKMSSWEKMPFQTRAASWILVFLVRVCCDIICCIIGTWTKNTHDPNPRLGNCCSACMAYQHTL